jgi:hypothetical protein
MRVTTTITAFIVASQVPGNRLGLCLGCPGVGGEEELFCHLYTEDTGLGGLGHLEGGRGQGSLCPKSGFRAL